jgi:Uma2 family endonuclease
MVRVNRVSDEYNDKGVVVVAATAKPASGPDLYRIDVDEYETLASTGALKDPRVELVDGYLVRKMTKKPPHVFASDAVREALAPMLPKGWWLREEKPVRIPDYDEPEPNISVVRGSRKDYLRRHPGPRDLALLVEVSESSLSWDRKHKREIYRRAKVPQYWIVNLKNRVVEVSAGPKRIGRVPLFSSVRKYKEGEAVPVLIEGVEVGKIRVSDILPPT